MRKRWLALIIVIICLFFGFGLYWRTVSHKTFHLTEAVQTANSPERIVSLAPNLTEILFALGLGERVVAVSNNSDYPAAAAGRNKVGTFWQPNTEAIIASKPQLVITLWFEQQKTVADSLGRLGYQALTLKINKIEGLLSAIQKIGSATGCEQRADKLAEDISRRLNELQLKLGSTRKVKILWVIQAEPLRVAGRNTFINELIEAGPAAKMPLVRLSRNIRIATEELLACGAEVIIQSAMGAANIDTQQQAAQAFWSKWANLPAVKNNKIYVIESDTVLRLGPRLPQGVEMIAGYLHPDTLMQKHDAQPQVR